MKFFPGLDSLKSSPRVLVWWLPIVFVGGLSWLSSCKSVLPETQQIEFVYVGPATASLREDLASRSSAVTTVKHGDRLEIVDTRRRLVRARTEQGAEGWIDANLLLTPDQMEEFKRITELASTLPSQGKATVSDVLNGHPETNRKSPGSFQIAENGKVEVLAHRTAPRNGHPSLVVAAIRKRAAPPPKNKTKKNAPPASLLPPPSVPGPPLNWVALSRPRMSDVLAHPANPSEKAIPGPPAVDDWSLVRTKDGQVGWVLTRMLYMEIPDELIRYTGGFRVTAYLDLGEVPDEGRGKHNWVWTTSSASGKTADFDSFHVLVWNPTKHRYETAHLEKDLDGHYPLSTTAFTDYATVPAVSEKPVRPRRSKRNKDQVAGEDATAPPKDQVRDPKEQRFSLVANDPADGRPYVRVYSLTGRRVRQIARIPVPPAPEQSVGDRPVYDSLSTPPPTTNQEKGWWEKSRVWLLSKVPVLRRTSP